MNLKQKANLRLGTLLIGAAAVVTVALPYLGGAQDATPQAEEPSVVRGAQIYSTVCLACHQTDGNGIAGIYLPLNGNGLISSDDPTVAIQTILNGRGGMPRFDSTYSDAEIASILTYLRQEWDNDAGPVTEEQVAEVRAASVATPIVSPTPEGQIPEGQTHPDEREQPKASPDASPEATPEN